MSAKSLSIHQHRGPTLTVTNNSLSWKRYLSGGYLAGKVQEKGLVWTVRAGLGLVGWHVGRSIPIVLLGPIVLLLALARVRFLTDDYSRLGHLVGTPEFYVKSGLLGWRPRYFGLLLAPAGSVVIPRLLSYWGSYITIVTNPVVIAVLRPLAKFKRLQYTKGAGEVVSRGGSKTHVNAARYQSVLQTQYDARYPGQPVLNLSRSDFEDGWRCLQKLGVPRDAWFVCLHAREAGYLPHLAYTSYHDTDVYSYMLAAEAMVQRGGWVIRMGDPSMKPLPPMAQVIDYVHSEVRCDWMDVFCFSQCRFFLGSASGASSVPVAFGVPIAVANQAPMGLASWAPKDIGIPKLYWSVTEDRYLTFEEVLLSPLGRFTRTARFEAAGISLIDNSPEEIRDLSVEIMDRLDGSLRYSDQDDRLQERFKSLLEPESEYVTSARVGREFMRKYEWLLPDETPVD